MMARHPFIVHLHALMHPPCRASRARARVRSYRTITFVKWLILQEARPSR
jgi:hypothetical protein